MEDRELLEQIELGAKNSFVVYESPKEDDYLSGLITVSSIDFRTGFLNAVSL